MLSVRLSDPGEGTQRKGSGLQSVLNGEVRRLACLAAFSLKRLRVLSRSPSLSERRQPVGTGFRVSGKGVEMAALAFHASKNGLLKSVSPSMGSFVGLSFLPSSSWERGGERIRRLTEHNLQG